MSNRKAIICYLSFSGNTEEVAEEIERNLKLEGYDVESYRVGSGVIPDLSLYDIVFIGTFTWDRGSTPDFLKDFIADVGYKPDNVYVFGTGDTQFGGDELFCRATERVANFYSSNYHPLKIEQSPRGSQEIKIHEWIKGVISIDKTIK